MSSGETHIGKPGYASDIREWKGKKVDIGLYWLTKRDGWALPILSNPYFIVPQDLPEPDYREFVSWAKEELLKKHGMENV